MSTKLPRQHFAEGGSRGAWIDGLLDGGGWIAALLLAIFFALIDLPQATTS